VTRPGEYAAGLRPADLAHDPSLWFLLPQQQPDP